jgi:hypothetical protein
MVIQEVHKINNMLVEGIAKILKYMKLSGYKLDLMAYFNVRHLKGGIIQVIL